MSSKHKSVLRYRPARLIQPSQFTTGIRDGLRALQARDRAIESWLHHQVGPAYDALKADPLRAVTADQVRARLATEPAKAR